MYGKTATRFPWFGMTATNFTEQRKRKEMIENRNSRRSIHGYLPPEICESCRLPECKWNPNGRTCPMDEEYLERTKKKREQQKRYDARKVGENEKRTQD